MKKETTPQRITEEIKALCNQVVPEEKASFVRVIPLEWCQLRECFPNVRLAVKENGGRQINGWAIWQWANIMVEAEAHAIWETAEGEYIDITPHNNGEKEILFLRDNSMVYENKTILSVRKPLTSSPLVAELIRLLSERDQIMVEATGKEYSISKELYMRIINIQTKLYAEVGRNDPCPCQSGIKYKKCCRR